MACIEGLTENTKHLAYGRVIVLNGASSAGKTTLAHRLQDRLSEPYLHCQLDMFWNMTPSNIPASSSTFPNMKLAMARSVKALAETGHNVIVDVVQSGLSSHQHFTSSLSAIDTTFVKVECSLEELERREQARGDRKIGLAKSQFTSAHDAICYDLALNTGEFTPDECAALVDAHLETSRCT